jgi:hypothetical protein
MLAPFSRLLRVPETRKLCTRKQLRFLVCKAKLRTDCSGRRTGKSFVVQIWLVEEWASRPGESSIFMALSQEHAIKIGWETIRELNERLQWGAVYNGTDGTWTWPNGFTLYYMGCKDKRSANFVRGVPKIHRLAVDECGQIPDVLLQYLIVDVVEPTMADTDGDVCMTGTPSDVNEGFYEETMKECEALGAHFTGDARDNPHLKIPGAEFIARALKKRFGGNERNATFRREYLGERVQEEGILVYPRPIESLFYEPTPGEWNYTAMGIDIGWSDGWGFTVVRAREANPGAHIVWAQRESHVLLPRAAAIAERLRVEHGVSEIFVDSAGGGGRTICETLSASYGLDCEPADKRARRMRIEQVRTMLDAGTLRGTRGACDQLMGTPGEIKATGEWAGIPWNLERNDHREGYVDECTDGLQYALQGQGFTHLTEWKVEDTPEQEYAKRVAQVMRNKRNRVRAGRR